MTGLGTMFFSINSSLKEFQVGFSPLFHHFPVDNVQFWAVLDGSFHMIIPFVLMFIKPQYINTTSAHNTLLIFLTLSVILLSMMILTSTLIVFWPDLWQQLGLAFELQSELWDTVNWGRKWLVVFNAKKNQIASFGNSNWREDGWTCPFKKIF